MSTEERTSVLRQADRELDDSGEDWGDVTSPGLDMYEQVETHLTDMFVFAEK